MKKTKLSLFAVFLLLLCACETPGQKMLDLKAEEQQRDADEAGKLIPLIANMGECSSHLKVNILTADKSPTWKRFAKSHHIDSYPTAMSDADLKDCLQVAVR